MNGRGQDHADSQANDHTHGQRDQERPPGRVATEMTNLLLVLGGAEGVSMIGNPGWLPVVVHQRPEDAHRVYWFRAYLFPSVGAVMAMIGSGHAGRYPER
jgi:hypothetical protein